MNNTDFEKLEYNEGFGYEEEKGSYGPEDNGIGVKIVNEEVAEIGFKDITF